MHVSHAPDTHMLAGALHGHASDSLQQNTSVVNLVVYSHRLHALHGPMSGMHILAAQPIGRTHSVGNKLVR